MMSGLRLSVAQIEDANDFTGTYALLGQARIWLS